MSTVIDDSVRGCYMYMYHFRQKRISDYNKLQVTKRRFLDLKFIKIKVKWHVDGCGYGVERHS